MVDSNVEKPKHCIMFEIFNKDKDKDIPKDLNSTNKSSMYRANKAGERIDPAWFH